MHDMVVMRRRRFIGHILQLPPTRLTSLAIEWRPEEEHWKRQEDMARHSKRR